MEKYPHKQNVHIDEELRLRDKLTRQWPTKTCNIISKLGCL